MRILGTPRPVLVVALVVLLVLALLVVLLVTAQRRLVYFPDTSDPPPPARHLPGGRDVTLTTGDGLSLGAWYAPPAAGAPDRQRAVLVAPGNGGHRQLRAPLGQSLVEAGFAVLLLDYRGYGGNPGRPTETGLALDVRAAHDYLVQEAGFPPEALIYFGESLGAGVVAELATDRPPAGMVLRSPFLDLAEVGQHHYPLLPVRWLLWDRYPVGEYVAEVDAPVTVVYGTQDTIVPPAQSRAVADRAAGPVSVVAVPGADHNDPALLDGDHVTAAVVALAER